MGRVCMKARGERVRGSNSSGGSRGEGAALPWVGIEGVTSAKGEVG